MTPPEAPAPVGSSEDGWIAWAGGECPVPAGLGCQVRYRDGFVSPVKAAHKIARSDAIWAHDPDMRAFHITVYRIVEAK